MATSSPIIFLTASYQSWSETFIQQDRQCLQKAGIKILPVAVFAEKDVTDGYLCLKKIACGVRKQSGVSFPLPKVVRSHLSLWRYGDLVKRCLEIIKQNSIKHIHAEFADLPGLIAAESAKLAGISYSIGVHAKDIHCLKFSPTKMFSGAKFITVCNKCAYDALMKMVPNIAPRTHLLYHGIDLDKIRLRRSQNSLGRLLFVGRFVEKKGLSFLVNALQLLLAEREFTLTMVGDGPLFEGIKARLLSFMPSERLVFFGVLNHEQVLDEMRRSQALLMAAKIAKDGDRDGIPNVMLEAMALGLPVLGRCVGGIGEVLSDDTGWIIPNSADSAMLFIKNFLQLTHEEVEQKTTTARHLLEEKFELGECSQKRVDVFNSYL